MIFRRLWRSSPNISIVFKNAKEILGDCEYSKFCWVSRYHYPMREKWNQIYSLCGKMLITIQQDIFTLIDLPCRFSHYYRYKQGRNSK